MNDHDRENLHECAEHDREAKAHSIDYPARRKREDTKGDEENIDEPRELTGRETKMSLGQRRNGSKRITDHIVEKGSKAKHDTKKPAVGRILWLYYDGGSLPPSAHE